MFNYQTAISKPINELTDEEIEELLVRARRLSDKIPGAMNLFDLPGTKFGYAHLIEREQIRRKLIREGADPNDVRLHFDIVREQEHIHKNDPKYRDYQKVLINTTKATNSTFTAEELQHIIWMFENSNDPMSVSVANKAQNMLGSQYGQSA